MDVRFRMDSRYRDPQDRKEIARRVKAYARQVERYGRIFWLRKVKHGAMESQDETFQTQADG